MKSTVVILLTIFLTLTAHAKSKTIHILTGSWPPYLSEDLPGNGALAQITREAFSLVNIDVKYTFLPWARVYIKGTREEGDLLLAYSKSAKRKLHFKFGTKLFTGKYHFFYHKDDPISWRSLFDLEEKLIGTPRGYSGMGVDFLKAEESGEINVVRLNNDFQAFNLLAKRRIQAVPSDANVGNYYKNFLLDEKHADELMMHPLAMEKTDYHIIGPKNKKTTNMLLKLFNKGFQKLKRSGRYKEILKHHQIR